MNKKLLFNEIVKAYDKHRPTYPKALYQAIFNYSQMEPSSYVIEVGCGTGHGTLPFLNKGYRVHALEIGDALAAFTKEKW